MGHCIHAIIAPSAVGDTIARRFPALPRVRTSQPFDIFPIEAEFVDAVCHDPPPQCTDTFMVLTDGFIKFLMELSKDGPLAYVETEYFGGVGGQGACVFDGGEVVKTPDWSGGPEINDALRAIGVSLRPGRDHFDSICLGRFRSNDDLADAASVGPSEEV